MKRVCIYPKDVASITGLSLRKAQDLLKTIRLVLNKKQHQFITIKEFAEYTDISDDLIDLK